MADDAPRRSDRRKRKQVSATTVVDQESFNELVPVAGELLQQIDAQESLDKEGVSTSLPVEVLPASAGLRATKEVSSSLAARSTPLPCAAPLPPSLPSDALQLIMAAMHYKYAGMIEKPISWDVAAVRAGVPEVRSSECKRWCEPARGLLEIGLRHFRDDAPTADQLQARTECEPNARRAKALLEKANRPLRRCKSGPVPEAAHGRRGSSVRNRLILDVYLPGIAAATLVEAEAGGSTTIGEAAKRVGVPEKAAAFWLRELQALQPVEDDKENAQSRQAQSRQAHEASAPAVNNRMPLADAADAADANADAREEEEEEEEEEADGGGDGHRQPAGKSSVPRAEQLDVLTPDGGHQRAMLSFAESEVQHKMGELCCVCRERRVTIAPASTEGLDVKVNFPIKTWVAAADPLNPGLFLCGRCAGLRKARAAARRKLSRDGTARAAAAAQAARAADRGDEAQEEEEAEGGEDEEGGEGGDAGGDGKSRNDAQREANINPFSGRFTPEGPGGARAAGGGRVLRAAQHDALCANPGLLRGRVRARDIACGESRRHRQLARATWRHVCRYGPRRDRRRRCSSSWPAHAHASRAGCAVAPRTPQHREGVGVWPLPRSPSPLSPSPVLLPRI